MSTSTLTSSGPGTEHDGGPQTPAPGFPSRSRGARFLRGRPDEPRWARPSLLALLLGTAVLYLVGLSANGYANEFYAAAVQAGSTSWKAFFFGSLDAGNSIAVDKADSIGGRNTGLL